jgi:hypothetical protein
MTIANFIVAYPHPLGVEALRKRIWRSMYLSPWQSLRENQNRRYEGAGFAAGRSSVLWNRGDSFYLHEHP